MSRVNLNSFITQERIINPMIGINHTNPRILENVIENENNVPVIVDSICIMLKLWFVYIPILKDTINKKVASHGKINHKIYLRRLNHLPSFCIVRIDVFSDKERNRGDENSIKWLRTATS